MDFVDSFVSLGGLGKKDDYDEDRNWSFDVSNTTDIIHSEDPPSITILSRDGSKFTDLFCCNSSFLTNYFLLLFAGARNLRSMRYFKIFSLKVFPFKQNYM